MKKGCLINFVLNHNSDIHPDSSQANKLTNKIRRSSSSCNSSHSFDNFTVMNSEIIWNKVDFFGTIFNLKLHKFDEYLWSHVLFVDHELNFTLVGYGWNHIERKLISHVLFYRCLTFWCIKTILLPIMFNACLFFPKYFCIFLFGVLFYFRVFFIEPFL